MVVTPTPPEEAVASAEGTALAVVTTGLLALLVSTPLQVVWLVAALAVTVLTPRRRAPTEPSGHPGP